LIITLTEDEIDKVISEFDENEFYCPPRESILIESRRYIRGHFNIIHHETGFKADFFIVGGDRLAEWAMKNIVELDFGGQTIRIAPVEYVIVKKLAFYREGQQQKHLDDVKNILEYSKDRINFESLEKFIHEYSLGNEWELLR
jgi:hypothetical protein